jgi:uncharacterized protein YuzE
VAHAWALGRPSSSTLSRRDGMMRRMTPDRRASPTTQAVRSEAMKVTYDSATDTLTVLLRAAAARISEEEKSGVILHYDADDRLIAIEILNASTRVDEVDTVQLQVIPKPSAKDLAAAE